MTSASTPDPNSVTPGEFKERLVSLCLQSGVKGLPRRKRDQHIVLKSVVLTLDKTEEYSETAVNQRLQIWLNEVGRSLELDHVRLRRHLIDAEFLGRSRDGSRYWVAVFSRNQVPFDAEVENIDVYNLVQQRRAEQANSPRRATRDPRPGPKSSRQGR